MTPSRERPPLKLTRGQRTALGLAGLLVLATAMTGPYLAVEQAHQANQQIRALQQQQTAIQRTAEGIQRVLDFIASVQSGPQAKASRAATGWYIRQFEAICAAEPGCREEPLPDSLKSQLVQPAATPTTPPTTTPP